MPLPVISMAFVPSKFTEKTEEAVVKQQITEAITARNLRGNFIALMFDAFKAWIKDTKGMAYEEWAQTNPDVAKTYLEFNH